MHSKRGNLTFSGNNTYTGDTTISAGTLKLTGTLADTTDVINSGTYDVDATDTIQSLSGSGAVELANGIALTSEIQVMTRFQAWYLVQDLLKSGVRNFNFLW